MIFLIKPNLFEPFQDQIETEDIYSTVDEDPSSLTEDDLYCTLEDVRSEVLHHTFTASTCFSSIGSSSLESSSIKGGSYTALPALVVEEVTHDNNAPATPKRGKKY